MRLPTAAMRGILVVGVLVLAGGCSDATEASSRASNSGGDLFAPLRDRPTAGAFDTPYSDLRGALPNVSYRSSNGRSPAPASDAVIVGTVRAVTQAASVVQKSPADAPIVSDYGNPAASWRALELEVIVERVLAGDVAESIVVGFPVYPGEDDQAVMTALETIERAVFVLEENSPAYPHADVYGLLEQGTLLVTVGSNGGLDLPFIEPERRQTLLKSIKTLRELDAAVDEAPREEEPS